MVAPDRDEKAMQFVKPNALHRPGLAVGEDHGFADEVGLGLLESAEDRRRTDLRRVRRQQLVRRQQVVCFAHPKQTAQRLQCSAVRRQIPKLSPCQLSVFPLDYRQSYIRGAAFNG